MANLIKRNQATDSPATYVWDPFRLMRDMLHWDPYRELDSGFGGDARSFVPAFDVKETKDAYVFRADVPGVKNEDLDISLTGNRLSISGHRRQERHDEGERYYASESASGSFSRAFTLPEGADGEHITADLKDGVLQLTVPKKPEVQPRRIALGSPGNGNGDGKEKA